jgi:hypothetical protein
MILLKCVGGALFLFGVAYFLIKRPEYLPRWRNVLGYGCMFGLLNAAFVIILGRLGFLITPIFLITIIALFYFEKFPHYRPKHLLGLSIVFILSSVTFFIGIAGTFFHLAVEGKI